MGSFRGRRPSKRKFAGDRVRSSTPDSPQHLGGTGAEAAYLKSSVDNRSTVTVILTTGERFRGRIRYYDRDCLSLGLVPRGPNLFLRKSSVLYISED